MSVTYPFYLSFAKEVSIVEKEESKAILDSPFGEVALHKFSEAERAAFQQLTEGETTAATLDRQVSPSGGFMEAARFQFFLESFVKRGLLYHSVHLGNLPLATLVPSIWSPPFGLKDINSTTTYQLSRFAYTHMVDSETILETALSPSQIVLKDWRASAIVGMLSQPQTCADLAAQIPDLAEECARGILILLASAKMLVAADEPNEIESSEAVKQWEFHDLLFHTRSRVGRHDRPMGLTFRFLGDIEPPPAVKPDTGSPALDLYTPDMEALAAEDPSFSSVLENRKSIRQHGDRPLTAQQLGEFLYRCARIRYTYPSDNMEYNNRPHPGSGGLELYPLVNECEGLDSGLYYYRPQAHQLRKISETDASVAAITECAQKTSRAGYRPQVLIVVAARFALLNWKCEGVAYAVLLKDVGALYQTMYLVATAMGLAPCALGGGDADLFARVAGTDYYAETSVGEFMLGSC